MTIANREKRLLYDQMIIDGEYREDAPSSLVTYRGWAPRGSLTNEAKWTIEREYLSGSQTIREHVGSLSSIWDNRYNLFDDMAYAATLSTQVDGVNDVINFDQTAALIIERTNAFTIAMWVHPTHLSASSPTTSTLIGKKVTTGNATGWKLDIRFNGRVELYMTNTSVSNELRLQSTSKLLVNNTWSFITITHDGTGTAAGVNFYVNGEITTKATTYDTLTSSILNALVDGKMFTANDGAQAYSGDALAFYRLGITLSAVEVLELFNGHEPMNPTNHTQSAQFTAFYKLGDGDTAPIVTDSISGNAATMVNFSDEPFRRFTPKGVLS